MAMARFRSPLATLLAALALVVQLAVLPSQPLLARAAPLPVERIAADLKATFGEAAALCIRADGSGAPHAPDGDCDDHCPLCRFAAQAASLVAPDLPTLPAPFDTSCRTLGFPAKTCVVLFRLPPQNRARAPPLPV
jgi:hypothetical protein